MGRIVACAILAISLLLPGLSQAETVTFVTTEFPPYIIKQGDNVSGFQVEFVQQLCRKLGIEPKFIVVPWNRALEYVRSGRADGILTPVYSEERAQYIYFTDEPIGHERISVMALRGSGIKANSLGDLKNEIVGVMLGYSYGKEFDGSTIVRKDVNMTNEALLNKLNLNRYKLLVSDEYVINYVARQAGQEELETVLNLHDNPQFLGFSKAIGERGRDLTKRFSQAIHELQQDGTLEKIRKKYF